MAELGELLVKLSADLKSLQAGLGKARSELSGFRTYAEGFAASLKKTLTFAGVAVGLYEIGGALKSFAVNAAMVGARTETLSVAMEHVGKNVGVSSETLNYYVEQLKGMGITTQEAMLSITKFLVQGLPLDKITQLADVARNTAALVGKNTSEAFNEILVGITTQQPEILRRYLINIGNLDTVMKQAVSKLGVKSAQDIDPVTKSLIMFNTVIDAGRRLAGAYAAMMGTVGKQMTSLTRYIDEAKNALWAFFKPIMEGVIGGQMEAFKSLEAWAKQNQAALREAGNAVGEWIRWTIKGIKAAADWAAKNWGLIKTLGQFAIASKVTAWMISLSSAVVGAAKSIIALVTAIKTVQVAMGGWLSLIIKVVAGLAALGAYKVMTEGMRAPESPEEAALLGEAAALVPEKRPPKVAPPGAQKLISTLEQAEAEAKAAFEKALAESKERMGAGPEAGAAKELNEDLLRYLTEYLEAKRQLEIKYAEESYNTFKAEQQRKKAELDLYLQEGKISGQEYHQAMIKMAEDETAAAIRLIDTKIVKEKESYKWAQKELQSRAEAGEISAEALDLAQKRLQVEHAARLKELEEEGVRTKIKLEKELLDLQKQEYENRRRIADIMASGAEETALGPIAEKEAEIVKLLRERRDLREEINRLGATPIELSEFDRITASLKFVKRYGDEIRSIGEVFRGMFSDLADAVLDGGKNLEDVFRRVFDDLIKIAISPALDAIEQIINDFFRWLFESIGWGGGFFGGGGWGGGWFGFGEDLWFGQHGGLVTKPILGMIAEAGPEAVIPLDKLHQFVGGAQVNLQINVINNTRQPVEASMQRSEDSIDLILDEAMANVLDRRGKFTRMLTAMFDINANLARR